MQNYSFLLAYLYKMNYNIVDETYPCFRGKNPIRALAKENK